MEKYRVHEVAKDFGLPTKVITEILTKYATAPKNHMQVLTDRELSIIFDYLTVHNQVSGIQVIFADAAKEQPKAAPAQQKSEPKPAQQQNAPRQNQQGGNRPQQSFNKAGAPANKPAQQQNNAPRQNQQPAQPVVQQQPATRVPQKKIVDTRKGGDVNLDITILSHSALG